jgi:hypothetical protein
MAGPGGQLVWCGARCLAKGQRLLVMVPPPEHLPGAACMPVDSPTAVTGIAPNQQVAGKGLPGLPATLPGARTP